MPSSSLTSVVRNSVARAPSTIRWSTEIEIQALSRAATWPSTTSARFLIPPMPTTQHSGGLMIGVPVSIGPLAPTFVSVIVPPLISLVVPRAVQERMLLDSLRQGADEVGERSQRMPGCLCLCPLFHELCRIE